MNHWHIVAQNVTIEAQYFIHPPTQINKQKSIPDVDSNELEDE